MEISVIGGSQVNIGRYNNLGFCSCCKILNSKNNNKNLKGLDLYKSQSVGWPSKSAVGFSLRASTSSQNGAAIFSEKPSKIARTKPIDGVKVYVGLPLDTVSNCNTVNHARAIAIGLKALKLLGVDGVELPVWWGIVERETMGKYNWTSYHAIVEMVQKLDLKLHVSLCFHSSEEHKIPLPEWVSRTGESDPNIYFTDRSGQQYKNCLSLSVDDLPVLDGKTPLEVYRDFCGTFKSEFSHFLGSTITGVSIGLGPDGELGYPSHHKPLKNNSHYGFGEFQCYDKYMLRNLRQYAEELGNPLWGLGGPHDAPGYNDTLISSGFFNENGGSWESPYGDFFLSWYSALLVSHGDRILSLAVSTFKDVPVTISGKVPLIHSWFKSRSHPSELTAGFYNTVNRDGYESIAEIFARNSCKIIIPGMDLSDEHQPVESRSSPESLLEQIIASCRDHRVEVSGQNLLVSGDSRRFELIKKHLLDEHVTMDLFTYQRMGAYFFSPEHFPAFTRFIRGLYQPVKSSDDLPVEVVETNESIQETDRQMQAA
ncbi:inactive beta-amylase 9-like [Primulina tabacum]|uniref:inactive beta-amylase 9-like n=1 Tax=Primulina tabacum TaxID=48773 RepID=UPI003F597057